MFINTPADPLRSFACVEQRRELITKNLETLWGIGLESQARPDDESNEIQEITEKE
jgi:hypothetical protein